MSNITLKKLKDHYLKYFINKYDDADIEKNLHYNNIFYDSEKKNNNHVIISIEKKICLNLFEEIMIYDDKIVNEFPNNEDKYKEIEKLKYFFIQNKIPLNITKKDFENYIKHEKYSFLHQLIYKLNLSQYRIDCLGYFNEEKESSILRLLYDNNFK